ncbi:MAG: DUF2804 domain-containing protein [Deltaproteobacteria bacterium]|nr:DUF2804 domain-containing protein [Deltaproteobacteria bacterium]
MSSPAPLPTPERIVEQDGHVHTGWFECPFVHANLAEADPFGGNTRGALGRMFAGATGRSLRALRLKEWHYTSVVTERILFACAVVDVGYVGNAFAYVVDRASGRKYEYGTLTPGAAGILIASNSIDGTTSIRFPGFGAIALHNDSVRGERRIECDLDGRSTSRPRLRASIAIRDDGRVPAPIVTVEESEPRCWLYTHKCYGLEAEGSVEVGDLGDAFPLGGGLAGLDYNRGYRPRETYWNWAAAAGRASCGARVGFNLTTSSRPGAEAASGAQDSGDCALWLGADRVKLARVRFEYDRASLMSEWRIVDDEGLVDLRFAPAGERAEDVNFGLVISRFHQPYGVFRGTLRDRTGRSFTLDDVYGVVEQHFARW